MKAAVEAKSPVISSESVFIPSKVARPLQLVALYDGAFTEPTLRGWIWNASWLQREPWPELRECIIRIGRVVLIDVRSFDRWLGSTDSMSSYLRRCYAQGEAPVTVLGSRWVSVF